MTKGFLNHLTDMLETLRTEGLIKTERAIRSAQGAHVQVNGQQVINLCANN